MLQFDWSTAIVCTKLLHSGTRARKWYADAAVQQLHATNSLSRCYKMHLCSYKKLNNTTKISMNATAFFISYDQVANFSLSKMLIDKKKSQLVCVIFCFTVCGINDCLKIFFSKNKLKIEDILYNIYEKIFHFYFITFWIAVQIMIFSVLFLLIF